MNNSPETIWKARFMEESSEENYFLEEADNGTRKEAAQNEVGNMEFFKLNKLGDALERLKEISNYDGTIF